MFGSEPIYLHLITICLGLIIAFGLQQIVDLLLRRRRARQQPPAEAKTPSPTDDSIPPPP
jgi:hypothetical protein